MDRGIPVGKNTPKGVYVRLALSACAPFSLQAIIASHGSARLSPFFVEHQTAALGQSGDRVDLGGLDRLVEGEGREDRG